MSTNLDLKSLQDKLVPMLHFLRRYLVLTTFIILVLAGGFLVYQVNALTNAEPSEEAVSEKLKAVQRPHIDQSSIDKMVQLQDQNVEVKSLFESARDNPFSE